MNNELLKEEELEKVSGGETYFVLDSLNGLKDTIARNLVEGAKYYTINLMKAGKASDVRKLLDDIAEHNAAWDAADLYYTVLL